MATQPPPDTIDPHAPPESPPQVWPAEEPAPAAPDIIAPPPDRDFPDEAPGEVPAPFDQAPAIS
ncbi:MAG: hypothetical protein V4472_22075 [Pseudomonadota bacterium]